METTLFQPLIGMDLGILTQPWPWWFTGLVITATMLALQFLGKSFGISSTLRTMCAIGGAGKRIEFFNFDWKKEIWNLVFGVGAILGGFLASNYMMPDQAVHISSTTVETLTSMGVQVDTQFLAPPDIFSWESLLSFRGLFMIIVGGFFVGFGTAYAGGCTSGHAISGLSNLQLPSLIAVIGFFLGGLIMTHFILPFIL